MEEAEIEISEHPIPKALKLSEAYKTTLSL